MMLHAIVDLLSESGRPPKPAVPARGRSRFPQIRPDGPFDEAEALELNERLMRMRIGPEGVGGDGSGRDVGSNPRRAGKSRGAVSLNDEELKELQTLLGTLKQRGVSDRALATAVRRSYENGLALRLVTAQMIGHISRGGGTSKDVRDALVLGSRELPDPPTPETVAASAQLERELRPLTPALAERGWRLAERLEPHAKQEGTLRKSVVAYLDELNAGDYLVNRVSHDQILLNGPGTLGYYLPLWMGEHWQDFAAVHGELLSAAYHHGIQDQLRRGEIPEFFAYPPDRRLTASAWPRLLMLAFLTMIGMGIAGQLLLGVAPAGAQGVGEAVIAQAGLGALGAGAKWGLIGIVVLGWVALARRWIYGRWVEFWIPFGTSSEVEGGIRSVAKSRAGA